MGGVASSIVQHGAKHAVTQTVHYGVNQTARHSTRPVSQGHRTHTTHQGTQHNKHHTTHKNTEAQQTPSSLNTNLSPTTTTTNTTRFNDFGFDLSIQELNNNNKPIFNLTNQKIDDEKAVKIAEALKKSKSITTLNLNNNKITDKGAIAIAEALKINNTLQSLKLMDNKIGNEGIKSIACALIENTTLTSLNLMDNNTTEEGINAIIDDLEKNYSLTYCNLSIKTIPKLQEILKRNLMLEAENRQKAAILNAEGDIFYNDNEYKKAIGKYTEAIALNKQRLYIDNKHRAEKGYEQQLKVELVELFKVQNLNVSVDDLLNTDKTSLSICYQTISDEVARTIADKLKGIETINTINFSGSQISTDGITAIIEVLKTSKYLEKFDFSCSNLGDQKISILTKILQLSTLTHIYLGENDISIIGIKEIVEAVKLNNVIVHLDLHSNNIDDKGVKLIAEFLTNNRTLKHLDISGNKITPEGAKAIIAALRENTTITHIDLEQDNIDNTSKTIIEKYLQRNKNLMSFQKLADGINDKVATNIAINSKDKAIIKDTIEEIIHKAKELNNTTDIETITASMQKLIIDKSTKFKIMTIENQLNEIIDSQNINDDVSILGGDFVPAAG